MLVVVVVVAVAVVLAVECRIARTESRDRIVVRIVAPVRLVGSQEHRIEVDMLGRQCHHSLPKLQN